MENKHITITMKEEIYLSLLAASIKEDRSMSSFARTAIQEKIKQLSDDDAKTRITKV